MYEAYISTGGCLAVIVTVKFALEHERIAKDRSVSTELEPRNKRADEVAVQSQSLSASLAGIRRGSLCERVESAARRRRRRVGQQLRARKA